MVLLENDRKDLRNMEIILNEAAKEKLSAHLTQGEKILLTFEDGVGAYSQHAMIHMQVQFTINIIAADMAMAGYDTTIETNLVPFYIKGYSKEDLDEHMTLTLDTRLNSFVLSGDGGVIDDNVGLIDFTQKS